jgi:hypothetical protein
MSNPTTPSPDSTIERIDAGCDQLGQLLEGLPEGEADTLSEEIDGLRFLLIAALLCPDEHPLLLAYDRQTEDLIGAFDAMALEREGAAMGREKQMLERQLWELRNTLRLFIAASSSVSSPSAHWRRRIIALPAEHWTYLACNRHALPER